ncbi:MAG: hypothetical protein KDK24_05835 [Pseudooceanicola sp.]|nr:hypothetical protein [Pseudooceanicola sp.]
MIELSGVSRPIVPPDRGRAAGRPTPMRIICGHDPASAGQIPVGALGMPQAARRGIVAPRRSGRGPVPRLPRTPTVAVAAERLPARRPAPSRPPGARVCERANSGPPAESLKRPRAALRQENA